MKLDLTPEKYDICITLFDVNDACTGKITQSQGLAQIPTPTPQNTPCRLKKSKLF